MRYAGHLHNFVVVDLWKQKKGRIEMDEIAQLTEQTFGAAVRLPGITVIDFWAAWCGPCRAMAPQFERAAKLRPNYNFAKVDVDSEPAIAARYGITSIPTLIVLRDGEPIAVQTGAIDAEQLVVALDLIATGGTDATGAREAA